MDSSVLPKDEVWFLRVCHHISTGLYLNWCIAHFKVTGYELNSIILKMTAITYIIKPLNTKWLLCIPSALTIKNQMLLLTASLLFGSGFKSWARLSCNVLWFTSVLSGKSGHNRNLPRHTYVTWNTQTT